MRVLIISHEYPPVGGGGANACMKLAHEYVMRGNSVHIITVRYDNPSKETHEGSLHIHFVESQRKHAEHCSFVEMLSFLIKSMPVANNLLKTEHFDICQVFFGIPSGPVGYYLKHKYGLPYVIRFGGGDIPGFQKRFTLIYKFLAPFIKLLWSDADALVSNSSGLKDMAESFYSNREIRIITNGADLHNPMNRCESDVIRLLFVSRLIERKGLQDYLPYLGELNIRCKDAFGRRIKLQIVGDGPYRAQLESIVKAYGIEDLVAFEGQKNKSELPTYYAGADIFIFTSHKEGMPNVILEAMAYGLPIITTPCEGSEELIRGNGCRVQIELFNDRIVSLLSNKEQYRRTCENSILLIKERFGWDRIADEYLDLFSDIVAKNKTIN